MIFEGGVQHPTLENGAREAEPISEPQLNPMQMSQEEVSRNFITSSVK